MSYGSPNTPYGEQPQAPQGQPGYGHPPQAPPGYGYPPQGPPGGYAYPPQQGYPGGPAGYPGAHMEMPGGAKGARVILFILGSLQALLGLVVLLGGALFASALMGSSSSSAGEVGAVAGGVLVIAGILCIGLALWPFLTAVKMGKGRSGVRISGIIYGSFQAFFGGLSVIVNLAAFGSDRHAPVGAGIFSLVTALISLGLGVWVIVGLAKAGDYFRRPRF
ncbi:hypothetical protein ACFWSF_33435 [Streptomyces sp. NPDC058611]|uniref:hypothetical protein n=1 Tax=unclassified Streptomyces TaxID=2593676 RepID=UPI003647ED59